MSWIWVNTANEGLDGGLVGLNGRVGTTKFTQEGDDVVSGGWMARWLG